MRLVTTLGILMLAASPSAGQTPDSATRAEYQDLLTRLREAVDQVSARANEFRRDLRAAGETTVLARAGRLESACRDTRGTLGAARPRLAAARLTSGQAGARDSLLTAIDALAGNLRRECEHGLGPSGPGSRADTLRAWGPHRTAALFQAATAYHGAAARFARRVGVDLTAR
jgi:hypothetical protein